MGGCSIPNDVNGRHYGIGSRIISHGKIGAIQVVIDRGRNAHHGDFVLLLKLMRSLKCAVSSYSNQSVNSVAIEVFIGHFHPGFGSESLASR